jgi:Ser/Thr protein kinase RdoA (MazF antagonist)
VLVDGERLVLIDFDDAAMGEPALDVANFLAHLRLLALERRPAAVTVEAVAAAFHSRYAELDPSLDDGLVALLRGTALLRLAAIHQPRGGDALAASVLGESEVDLRSVLGGGAR